MKRFPMTLMRFASVNILRLILICLSALSSLLIIAGVALTVPDVNRWLLDKAIDSVPGLKVEQISGSVLDELVINDISYQSEHMELHVAQLSYRYVLSAISKGIVRFESITISGATYRQQGDDAKRQTSSLDAAFVLPFPVEIDQLTVNDANYRTATEHYKLLQATATLHGSGERLELPRFAAQLPSVRISGAGDVTLAKPFPFSVKLGIEGDDRQLGAINAQLQLQGDQQQINLSAQASAPATLDASGAVRLQQPQPDLQLHGHWRNLQWPLQGQADVSSEQGKFSLTGTVDDYRLGIDGHLNVPAVAPATFALSARGDTGQLQLTAGKIDTLGGRITTRGTLDWSHYPEWSFDIDAQDLQLAQLPGDYHGAINGRIQVSGNMRDGLLFDADLQNISGRVEGYPLQGQGEFRYADERLFFEHVMINAGKNALRAHGVAGKQSDLQFTLNADDLAVLMPGLTGRVDADGRLQGDLRYPTARLNLTSSGIAYQNYRSDRLQLKGDLDFSGAGRFDLALIGNGLTIAEHPIEKLELDSKGDYADHRLDLRLFSPEGRVELQAAGSYGRKNSQWLARIKSLQLADTAIGNWQTTNAATADVIFAADEVKFASSPLCLKQQKQAAKICFQAQADKMKKQAFAVQVEQISLDTFAAQYPKNMQLNGLLNGKVELQLTPKRTGVLRLVTEDAWVEYADGPTDGQRYPFNVKLHADLDGDRLESQLLLETIKQGKVSGEVTVNRVSSLDHAELAGAVSVRLPDLSFVNPLQSALAKVDGALSADATFKGAVDNPLLTSLNASVNNVRFFVPAAGIDVTDINLTVAKDTQQDALLSGTAQIGTQTVRLNGKINQSQSQGVELQLALQGERLKIVQLPEAEIWISPDLQLLACRQGIDVKGRVQVPKAVITVEQLPESAVAVSPDEVIVTDTGDKSERPIFAVNANVDIGLGQNVAIDAYGLQAKLRGNLQAVYNKDRLQLFNELNLVDGEYQIYGQTLKLEKGQLYFVGTVDNPNVNILASRTSVDKEANVTAYLQLTGPLKTPKTSIYSVPSLPDSEALAYLLTGNSLKNTGTSSSALLAKAAMYFGKDYVGGVMSAIGIDEFEFKSTSVGADSMVLGKQLAPHLYVRYIMDVLTSQMAIAVEYQLTKHISIETRSGDTNSADIKYNVEFD